MRRLVEYRQAKKREPRREHALEHIEILKSLSHGDQIQAAGLIREHLNGARLDKAGSWATERNDTPSK